MPPKNYLSEKKNVKMSFSTSHALTDWIKRYTKKKSLEDPKDDRFKSVSSFIHYALEKLMEIFEKEKTLDDLDRLVDKAVETFYDKLTFKALIDQTEESVTYNKYFLLSKEVMKLYLAFRSFLMQGATLDSEQNTRKDIKTMTERFGQFIRQNKIAKRLNYYQNNDKHVFEYEGNYENLHYEYSKAFTAIVGLAGLKVINSTYMKNYSRIDCEETDLFRESKLKLKQRLELSTKNMTEFIKYEHIIDDLPEHSWLNAYSNKRTILSFIDLNSGIEFVQSKINLLKKTVDTELIEIKILKLFQNFRWIRIENDEDLSFKFLIPNDKFERKIIFHIFGDKVAKIADEIYLIKTI